MTLRIALLTLFSIITLNSVANGQVQFKGPTEAKPEKVVFVDIEKADGEGLSVEALKNGEPFKGSFRRLRDDNTGLPVILLETDNSENCTYTIVGVVGKQITPNDPKSYKNLITYHVIKVGKGVPNPKPIVPDPDEPKPPKPSDNLADRLKKHYNPALESNKLLALLECYKDTASRNYYTYGDMETYLSMKCKEKLQDTDLRALRDEVGKYLTEQLGDDPRRINVDKAKSVFANILKALE
jgi:hypothetical protein